MTLATPRPLSSPHVKLAANTLAGLGVYWCMNSLTHSNYYGVQGKANFGALLAAANFINQIWQRTLLSSLPEAKQNPAMRLLTDPKTALAGKAISLLGFSTLDSFVSFSSNAIMGLYSIGHLFQSSVTSQLAIPCHLLNTAGATLFSCHALGFTYLLDQEFFNKNVLNARQVEAQRLITEYTKRVMAEKEKAWIAKTCARILRYSPPQTSEYCPENLKLDQRIAEYGLQSEEYCSRDSELDQRIKEFVQQSEELVEQSAEYCPRIVEYGQRSAEYCSRSSELNQRIAELGQRSAELDQRSTELGQRSSELGQRSPELDQQIAELDQRIAALGQRRVQLNQQITELGKRSLELDKRSLELGQRGVQLGQRRAQLSYRSIELDRRIIQLEQWIAELGPRGVGLVQWGAMLDQWSAELGQRTAELEQRIAELNQRILDGQFAGEEEEIKFSNFKWKPSKKPVFCPSLDLKKYKDLSDMQRALALKTHASCEAHAKAILAPSGEFQEKSFLEKGCSYVNSLFRRMSLATYPDKNLYEPLAKEAFLAVIDARDSLCPNSF